MKPPFEYRPKNVRGSDPVIKETGAQSGNTGGVAQITERSPLTAEVGGAKPSTPHKRGVQATPTVPKPGITTGTFDRNAYQREYMRKWRKKQKDTE